MRSVTGFSDGPAAASWTLSMPVRMTVAVVGRRLGLPDDDESPVAGLQHLDRDAVQAAERSPAITSPGVAATARPAAKYTTRSR